MMLAVSMSQVRSMPGGSSPSSASRVQNTHAGVHRASMGWILPEVLDPDGHTLRFYTMEHHTDLAPGEVTTIPGRRPSGSSARKPGARSAKPRFDPSETGGGRRQARAHPRRRGPGCGRTGRVRPAAAPQ
jgi:hypothetical protein